MITNKVKILKRTIPLFALLMVISGVAQANCRIIKPCANCAISLEQLDNAQVITIDGSDLPGVGSTTSGTDLVYSGGAANFALNGPYFTQHGSKVRVTPFLEFSTNWHPGTYDTCKRRNWLNKCVGWDTHEYDSGFTVEYTTSTNDIVLWSEAYHLPHENHRTLPLPTIICEGLLDRFEVRIRNAYGGTVDLNIHKLELDIRWND